MPIAQWHMRYPAALRPALFLVHTGDYNTLHENCTMTIARFSFQVTTPRVLCQYFAFERCLVATYNVVVKLDPSIHIRSQALLDFHPF